MTIYKIEGSPPWHPHALLIHKRREEQEAWDNETRVMLEKVESDLQKVESCDQNLRGILEKHRALIARCKGSLAKSNALRENLKKREAERQMDAQADSLRKALRKSEAMRKSRHWTKIPLRDRWAIQEAEVAARKALAKLEAQQQARKSTRLDTEKYRQAMIDRGVTFDRMMGAS